MTKDIRKIAKALLQHKAVQEVEDGGMDEGRFFVHLKAGWDWRYDPKQVTRIKSFGSITEARQWLKQIKWVGGSSRI